MCQKLLIWGNYQLSVLSQFWFRGQWMDAADFSLSNEAAFKYQMQASICLGWEQTILLQLAISLSPPLACRIRTASPRVFHRLQFGVTLQLEAFTDYMASFQLTRWDSTPEFNWAEGLFVTCNCSLIFGSGNLNGCKNTAQKPFGFFLQFAPWCFYLYLDAIKW